jgi:hypothetical protein
MRLLHPLSLTALTLALTMSAGAQSSAPASGPLVLLLPVSTRLAGLGDAGVSMRDDYAVFYNPAVITPSNGIGGSFARYGNNGTFGALASGSTVGPLNFGWGVSLVEFKAQNGSSYPFTPTELTSTGTRDALSINAAAGANFNYKGFRTGLGVNFADDRVAAGTGALNAARHESYLLGNLGVSHPLWQGTAALALTNISDRDKNRHVPTQIALGWNRLEQVGQFDVSWTTQISERDNRVGAAAGAELGYGWIEGWSAILRAGAHREDYVGQRPMTIGGTLNADRLSLDYALEFFEGNRYAHHISVRWR